jgi:integrase
MTRYPRSGKGRKWTILELKAIPAGWRGDSLSDGDGLIGEVRVIADDTVSVRFKYAFKWAGKVAWYQCGTWPTVNMEVIRQQRDDARDKVRAGVNPSDQKKADRIEAQAKVESVLAEAQRLQAERLPFQAMFDTWMTDGVARADGNAELRRTFEKDILPAIGHLEVREITDAHLRDALRAVGRSRGRARTAERMLSEMRQLFRWAERRKPWRALMIEGNPAALVDLKLVVPNDYAPVIRDRVLCDDEIRELRDVFALMQTDYDTASNRRVAERPVLRETQQAMWLCMSTACRIGELLKARWEHVDLEAGTWFVPRQNTKTKVAWDVFLSDFALRQFKALHALTKDSEWCFPASSNVGSIDTKTISKQIGDRQMQFKNRKPLQRRRNDNTLVLAKGKRGEWTPHDLRRTASTLMQQLGVQPDVIDRCQNHVLPGSKVRRHYMHYDFADEKRAAWQLLGKKLDAILGAGESADAPRKSSSASAPPRKPLGTNTIPRLPLASEATTINAVLTA